MEAERKAVYISSHWRSWFEPNPMVDVSGVLGMRNRSETYIKIYNKYRNEQDQKIADLQTEVRALTRMMEYLAAKVLE